MLKASSPSRVNAVAAHKILIEYKGLNEPHLTVEGALLNADEGPVAHAKFRTSAGWPKEVAEAAANLQNAIEEHLINVHFEEGSAHGTGTRTANAGGPPPGLVWADMGEGDDETGQL